MEKLKTLLHQHKRIQVKLIHAEGKTFLGDPCPCVYLHIFSEMACIQKSRSQGCPCGGGQAQGGDWRAEGLPKFVSQSPDTSDPSTVGAAAAQAAVPGSGGSAVQFIFIGPVILGLILITPVLLP